MDNMEIPTAVQAAVPSKETERYPREVAVSGSKQSAGMTLRISPALGKSSLFKVRALP